MKDNNKDKDYQKDNNIANEKHLDIQNNKEEYNSNFILNNGNNRHNEEEHKGNFLYKKYKNNIKQEIVDKIDHSEHDYDTTEESNLNNSNHLLNTKRPFNKSEILYPKSEESHGDTNDNIDNIPDKKI